MPFGVGLDPLDIKTQLGWLRELVFDDVDCYWRKWLEMALLVGVKPTKPA